MGSASAGTAERIPAGIITATLVVPNVLEGREDICVGAQILPENLPDCKPKVTAFGEGGALRHVCRPLRRALSPKGEPCLSFNINSPSRAHLRRGCEASAVRSGRCIVAVVPSHTTSWGPTLKSSRLASPPMRTPSAPLYTVSTYYSPSAFE